jgi:hypothetical protein
MARWTRARDETQLRRRITRQLRRRKIPNVVWRRAIELEYVEEAFRLQREEATLREFVAAQIARLREQALGYRKAGGRNTSEVTKLYDEYTRLRWEASGEAEVPADLDFGSVAGRDMVVVYARPWVPAAVVARLYAHGTASFPQDVHGPHLKSLHFYLFVTEFRAGQPDATWVETMAAWNEWITEWGLPAPGLKPYSHLSNFHRDYHRVKRAIRDRR